MVGEEVVVSRDLTLGGKREGKPGVIVGFDDNRGTTDVLVEGEEWPLVVPHDIEIA